MVNATGDLYKAIIPKAKDGFGPVQLQRHLTKLTKQKLKGNTEAPTSYFINENWSFTIRSQMAASK